MQGLKSVIFYIGGLLALILVSSILIGRVEVEINDLPPTATPVRTPAPTATPQPACLTTPGGLTHGYVSQAPFTTTLAPPDVPGPWLDISGTVLAEDCRTPVSGALIEVWHPDRNGRYDRTPPYSFRARLRTDAQGRYHFRTVKPGYTHTNTFILPPFIHYRISYEGRHILSTHTFFEGDYFLDDYWAAFPDLVISLTEQTGPAGPALEGTFDIAIPVEVE